MDDAVRAAERRAEAEGTREARVAAMIQFARTGTCYECREPIGKNPSSLLGGPLCEVCTVVLGVGELADLTTVNVRGVLGEGAVIGRRLRSSSVARTNRLGEQRTDLPELPPGALVVFNPPRVSETAQMFSSDFGVKTQSQFTARTVRAIAFGAAACLSSGSGLRVAWANTVVVSKEDYETFEASMRTRRVGTRGGPRRMSRGSMKNSPLGVVACAARDRHKAISVGVGVYVHQQGPRDHEPHELAWRSLQSRPLITKEGAYEVTQSGRPAVAVHQHDRLRQWAEPTAWTGPAVERRLAASKAVWVAAFDRWETAPGSS